MVDALGGCWSTTRMEEHLKELPETPAEYYRRFFERMEKLSRLLESEPRKELQQKAKPNINSIRTIVQPFIEFINTNRTDDSSTEEQYTCRILHSTLRDFLVDHPNILCDNSSDLRISAEWLARAYLVRCLGQSRYSGLLVRQEGRWLDVTEDPVDCHPLLVYAAKYWDKHLDDVTIAEIGSVESFITSPNFRTCARVQSLWVEAQFFVLLPSQRGRWLQHICPAGVPVMVCMSSNRSRSKVLDRLPPIFARVDIFPRCGGEKPCEILPYVGQLDRI
ncbi:hypothetical protein F4604DRAFT_1954301 [Suillus subluteus]|nr:hypothetical protein F4604DRAFT_1954301 [Suillus subluteus]